MTIELDYTFHAMGSDVRLLIGRALLRSAPPPLESADRERAFVLDFSHRLSRFAPDSELSLLNRDEHHAVPASKLLRAGVAAGVWAAERSHGLVEPTLVQAIERAGYATSLDGVAPASLREALLAASPRRPARPNPHSRWREIVIDDEEGLISRPRGVMIDTGGTGKGLCADAVAYRLRHYTRFVVDCGGDIAVGGVGAQLEPYAVEVQHPLTGQSVGQIRVARGGIATSGLNVRLWQTPGGRFAHHLLDPSSGEPAWTGLIGVTALGDTALEAETLSKMALLSGSERAHRVLTAKGGVIIHDSGRVEAIGPVQSQISSAPVRLPAA